jgi:gamma-glutamylcyclotransferase (GGCT)/AIG2-like uncharacterized protein YtfP
MLDRLFVYGTLMRGFEHPMSRLLSGSAEFLGAAHCHGRLYLVKHYPGLVLSDVPGDVVHGELYRMNTPQQLLATLDDYEGCGPDFAQPTAYLRQVLPVMLADGTVSEAWTYVYNWRVMESRRIASGRFWNGGGMG